MRATTVLAGALIAAGLPFSLVAAWRDTTDSGSFVVPAIIGAALGLAGVVVLALGDRLSR